MGRLSPPHQLLKTKLLKGEQVYNFQTYKHEIPRFIVASMKINVVRKYELKTTFKLKTAQVETIDTERKAIGFKDKGGVAKAKGIGKVTMERLEKLGAFKTVYFLAIKIADPELKGGSCLYMHRGYSYNEETVQAMFHRDIIERKSMLTQKVFGTFTKPYQTWEGESCLLYTSDAADE